MILRCSGNNIMFMFRGEANVYYYYYYHTPIHYLVLRRQVFFFSFLYVRVQYLQVEKIMRLNVSTTCIVLLIDWKNLILERT